MSWWFNPTSEFNISFIKYLISIYNVVVVDMPPKLATKDRGHPTNLLISQQI